MNQRHWVEKNLLDETEMIVKPSILSIMDFTESSLEALKWAADLAKKFDAHLTFLHPYRLNQLQKKEDMIWVKKKIDQDAASNFKKIANDLLKNQKIPYEFRSEVGFINDRVQEHARKNKTLFLVIGKDFAAENKEALNDLIAQTEVPLVIIPSTKH